MEPSGVPAAFGPGAKFHVLPATVVIMPCACVGSTSRTSIKIKELRLCRMMDFIRVTSWGEVWIAFLSLSLHLPDTTLARSVGQVLIFGSPAIGNSNSPILSSAILGNLGFVGGECM